MKMTQVKFSVVREDPQVELDVMAHFGCTKPLIVASGGCTLLSVKARHPELVVTGYDFNPAQLEHVRDKQHAVASRHMRALNVGDSDPEGLNESGAFERLFRVWRQMLYEFIATRSDVEAFFATASHTKRLEILSSWQQNPYWKVSFELMMHHPLLNVMFGSEATQHASPGSYPRYFESVFSSGLARADAPKNMFLHHLLLGHYLPEHAPEYLWAAKILDVVLVQGGLLDVPNLGEYDLIHLSNIFDWCQDDEIDRWCDHLIQMAAPGTAVVIRQLNNTNDLRPRLSPSFTFYPELCDALLAKDRSLFYNHIEVGVKQ